MSNDDIQCWMNGGNWLEGEQDPYTYILTWSKPGKKKKKREEQKRLTAWIQSRSSSSLASSLTGFLIVTTRAQRGRREAKNIAFGLVIVFHLNPP